MSTLPKKGCEEIAETPRRRWLKPQSGSYVLTFGVFSNHPIEQVPRGYIRHFVLERMLEDLSPEELAIFTKYSVKEATHEPPTRDRNSPPGSDLSF